MVQKTSTDPLDKGPKTLVILEVYKYFSPLQSKTEQFLLDRPGQERILIFGRPLCLNLLH